MKQQNGGKVKKQNGGEWISSGMKNSVQQSSSSMKNSVPKSSSSMKKEYGRVALSSLVLLHTTPMKIDKAMSLGDVKIYNLYYIL